MFQKYYSFLIVLQTNSQIHTNTWSYIPQERICLNYSCKESKLSPTGIILEEGHGFCFVSLVSYCTAGLSIYL
jgi:hypothetical protein